MSAGEVKVHGAYEMEDDEVYEAEAEGPMRELQGGNVVRRHEFGDAR